MEDTNSVEFKEFEIEFQAEMASIYGSVVGYKSVIIHSLQNGSIVVNHSVIFEKEIQNDKNITQAFVQLVEDVKTQLHDLKVHHCTQYYVIQKLKTGSVTTASSPGKDNDEGLCVDEVEDAYVNLQPPTEEEICRQNIPLGFERYYTPVLTNEGLTCVSFCNVLSGNKYLNCHIGKCQLQNNNTGPECFCPDTDIYMYTNTQCQGRVLKAGVYGGIGASIAFLFIIIITVAFYLYRDKHFRTWDLFFDSQSSVWSDECEEWNKQSKFSFKNEGLCLDENDLYNKSKAGTMEEEGVSVGFGLETDTGATESHTSETFKPNLEKVNTTVMVNLPRPKSINP
ncbi:mucin-3A-like [Hyperolius riggenbachi]|uniref:mucin-3A-like n=1 Tax=Hyperolius riggenbachi TaxID=752182 RepID=UPI0035A2FD6B